MVLVCADYDAKLWTGSKIKCPSWTTVFINILRTSTAMVPIGAHSLTSLLRPNCINCANKALRISARLCMIRAHAYHVGFEPLSFEVLCYVLCESGRHFTIIM